MPLPNIDCRVSEGKGAMVTTKPVSVRWTHKGEVHYIQIPEGFPYRVGISLRLGSLGLIDLLGPTFALQEASAAHDYAYFLRENDPGRAPSRAAAIALVIPARPPPITKTSLLIAMGFPGVIQASVEGLIFDLRAKKCWIGVVIHRRRME